MEIKQLPCKTSIHKQLRWNELRPAGVKPLSHDESLLIDEWTVSIISRCKQSANIMKGCHIKAGEGNHGLVISRGIHTTPGASFHRQKRVARNTALPHIPLVLILLTA